MHVKTKMLLELEVEVEADVEYEPGDESVGVGAGWVTTTAPVVKYQGHVLELTPNQTEWAVDTVKLEAQDAADGAQDDYEAQDDA